MLSIAKAAYGIHCFFEAEGECPIEIIKVCHCSWLVCGLCNNIVDGGVQLGCHHLFCQQCICAKLENAKGKPFCPVCSTVITDVGPLPPVVQDIIRDLQLQCDNATLGCSAIVNLSQLAQHVS